jgi:hypothetical protein
MKISLGDRVRDKITGFEGIVLGRCEYLYEATALKVYKDSLRDNGEEFSPFWIEEGRVEVVEAKKHVGFMTIKGEK